MIPADPALASARDRQRWIGRRHLLPRLAPRRPAIAVAPYFPQNPYQSLLYSACGADILIATDLQRALRPMRTGHADLLHLHWDEFCATGDGAAAQRAGVGAAMEALKRLQARGRSFVWTLHNAAPHEDRDRTAIEDFRRFLCQRAALIFVHGPAGQALLTERFGCDPARIRIVEHPSYRGWFPEAAPVPDPGTGLRLLQFGALRAYKGVDRLAEALARLAHPERIAGMHLAGNPVGEIPQTALEALPFPVTTTLRFIDDADLPALFAAADFSVFSHRRLLASGSVALSLTFGVPVICPDLGDIRASVPPEMEPFLYDPDEPDGLTAAIDRASALPRAALAELRAAALRFSEECRPEVQSRRLAEHLHAAGLLPRP